MKPITGQYECVHSSGVGLDYFTSRIDRITLRADQHFTLTIQNHSRATNAAQSLVKGQQVSAAAPETKREGTYSQQDLLVELYFAGGGQEQCQLAANGEGMQVGPNFFSKVSDSTILPPTQRLKQDMDDIARGIKIASTIGGMALKAAKTIQGTIQATQGSQDNSQAAPVQSRQAPPAQAMPNAGQYQEVEQNVGARARQEPVQQPPQDHLEAVFCDQCGARCRAGKRFCNNCGARLA